MALTPLRAMIWKDLLLFFSDRRSVIVSFIVPIVFWIQEGKPASPTFRDAVEVQKVLDTARLSDSSGAWETIRS